MHEAARRKLVLGLAGQATAVADREGGDQGGALGGSTDGDRALGKARAQLPEEAPDGRTALEDLDHFGAALDGDAAREQLRPPVPPPRLELAGWQVHASKD